MSSEIYEHIRSNPKFQELVSRRSRLAWALSAFVLVGFYGFVMVVAFAPAVIGQRLGGSTLTIGVAAGLTMFVTFWLLMASYVRRANGEFDRLTAELVKEASAPKARGRRPRPRRRPVRRSWPRWRSSPCPRWRSPDRPWKPPRSSR